MTSPLPHSDMQAVQAGDRRAFQRVVRQHQEDVLRYCLRVVGDVSLAEDIAQEVFLTLWKERERYVERGKLRLYLLKVARLRCLAATKKRRSFFALLDRYREGKATSERPLAKLDDEKALAQALRKLRPEHAELIVLRHLEGFELKEIQEVTGLREGTIKSRLSRGLSALREELDHVD